MKYVIGSINWTMFRHGYDDYQMSVEHLVQGMRGIGLGEVYSQGGKVTPTSPLYSCFQAFEGWSYPFKDCIHVRTYKYVKPVM